jgi:phosphoglycerol transferase MdoB-like AlkP superfamily enzyme
LTQLKELPRKAQETKAAQIAWPLLCLAAFLGLAWGFQLIYHRYGNVAMRNLDPLLFSLGWSLILSGIAVLLPGLARKVYMMVSILVFGILTLVHGALLNLFNRFFSFSDLGFAGDGAAFADLSYIQIPKKTLLLVLAALLAMAAAVFLCPKKGGLSIRRRLLAGLAAGLAGLVLIVPIHTKLMANYDVVVWDGGANAYATFGDSKQSLCHAGLYQYTFRDLWRTINPFQPSTDGMREELAQEVFSQLEPPRSNEMTGALAGKNLLLIQLEAIDTWMLNQKTMPNLWAIQQQSMDFTAHYAPAYITAGTFNTEFIVNTGLVPPASGVSVDAYSTAQMPYSLAHLFRNAGYAVNSFHGSPGDIYNRQTIHENWGYEAYHSGADMGMADFTMDSQLIQGFDQMTAGDPFFSFIITYSGHGPYTPGISASVHYDEMKALYPEADDVFVHAMAHARETDLFIGELFQALEESGQLDDTVVVFYSDHYNYYVMNDALVMEYKGVYDMNLLQRTPFFLYCKDWEASTIDKVNSSVDVLPTLANLFGLDTTGAWYAGMDLFSDQPGYVFFADSTWYDGNWYSALDQIPDQDYAARRSAQIQSIFDISRRILLSDYYQSAD